eukprot:361803-Chlamydomonas_euryale.AAC.2
MGAAGAPVVRLPSHQHPPDGCLTGATALGFTQHHTTVSRNRIPQLRHTRHSNVTVHTRSRSAELCNMAGPLSVAS